MRWRQPPPKTGSNLAAQVRPNEKVLFWQTASAFVAPADIGLAGADAARAGMRQGCILVSIGFSVPSNARSEATVKLVDASDRLVMQSQTVGYVIPNGMIEC